MFSQVGWMKLPEGNQDVLVLRSIAPLKLIFHCKGNEIILFCRKRVLLDEISANKVLAVEGSI